MPDQKPSLSSARVEMSIEEWEKLGISFKLSPEMLEDIRRLEEESRRALFSLRRIYVGSPA